VFLLLERGTLLISALLALNLAIEADPSTRILIDEVLAAPAATGATMAVGLLVLPRLSLVMPALALGERLSLRHAWRITRGNTLRLGAATALCILPAVTLATMVRLLSCSYGLTGGSTSRGRRSSRSCGPGGPSGISPSSSRSPLLTPFSSGSRIRSSPSLASRCCR
jgi:hypothetical protein